MTSRKYMLVMTVVAIMCLATLALGGGAWLYGFTVRQRCLLNLRAERDTAQDGVFFYAAAHPDEQITDDVPEWHEYRVASHHYRAGALPGGRCEWKVGPWRVQ